MADGVAGIRLAVIPGDGIGSEVVDAGLSVLDALCAPESGPRVEIEAFPWGSAYFEQHGSMLPSDGLRRLADFDAIYFGATGWPTVPDHVSLWGLRLAIVQGFDQCVNLRPVRLLPGVRSPLANQDAEAIDFVVIRENSEGEYSGAGGRVHRGLPSEVAIQTSFYSRRAIERVASYAFGLAGRRSARRVTSVTKSNASQYASVLWDEVVLEVAAKHPEIAFDSVLVDAAAAKFILAPGSLDVVVASNLHADILSDLAAALAGSLGVAPSANLHLDGRFPSMFEPVHGSAPTIAGKGIANPIAALLCLGLLLEHLGYPSESARIRNAVDATCRAGVLTPDLGGDATTREVTHQVIEELRKDQAEPALAAQPPTTSIGGSDDDGHAGQAA
jgi:tartrate dehydrogenase/decarboxylase/D-malate dehydrogenase